MYEKNITDALRKLIFNTLQCNIFNQTILTVLDNYKEVSASYPGMLIETARINGLSDNEFKNIAYEMTKRDAIDLLENNRAYNDEQLRSIILEFNKRKDTSPVIRAALLSISSTKRGKEFLNLTEEEKEAEMDVIKKETSDLRDCVKVSIILDIDDFNEEIEKFLLSGDPFDDEMLMHDAVLDNKVKLAKLMKPLFGKNVTEKPSAGLLKFFTKRQIRLYNAAFTRCLSTSVADNIICNFFYSLLTTLPSPKLTDNETRLIKLEMNRKFIRNKRESDNIKSWLSSFCKKDIFITSDEDPNEIILLDDPKDWCVFYELVGDTDLLTYDCLDPKNDDKWAASGYSMRNRVLCKAANLLLKKRDDAAYKIFLEKITGIVKVKYKIEGKDPDTKDIAEYWDNNYSIMDVLFEYGFDLTPNCGNWLKERTRCEIQTVKMTDFLIRCIEKNNIIPDWFNVIENGISKTIENIKKYMMSPGIINSDPDKRHYMMLVLLEYLYMDDPKNYTSIIKKLLINHIMLKNNDAEADPFSINLENYLSESEIKALSDTIIKYGNPSKFELALLVDPEILGDDYENAKKKGESEFHAEEERKAAEKEKKEFEKVVERFKYYEYNPKYILYFGDKYKAELCKSSYEKYVSGTAQNDPIKYSELMIMLAKISDDKNYLKLLSEKIPEII